MTVHKKLMQARVKLQGMELKKSGENKFAGYKYFELADFLPQTMQIFESLGLASVVSFDKEFAHLNITDVEDSTTIHISSPMAEANLKGAHPIQNLGAVMSYQRRYLWLAAMEIVEHDIIDATEPVAPVKAPVNVPKKIVGGDGAWRLEMKSNDTSDPTAWLQALDGICDVALGTAMSADDVMTIFKKNKEIFDKAKELDASFFKGLMVKFSEAKNRFKE